MKTDNDAGPSGFLPYDFPTASDREYDKQLREELVQLRLERVLKLAEKLLDRLEQKRRTRMTKETKTKDDLVLEALTRKLDRTMTRVRQLELRDEAKDALIEGLQAMLPGNLGPRRIKYLAAAIESTANHLTKVNLALEALWNHPPGAEEQPAQTTAEKKPAIEAVPDEPSGVDDLGI